MDFNKEYNALKKEVTKLILLNKKSSRFIDALKKTKGRLRWNDLVKRTPPKYTGFTFVDGE